MRLRSHVSLGLCGSSPSMLYKGIAMAIRVYSPSELRASKTKLAIQKYKPIATHPCISCRVRQEWPSYAWPRRSPAYLPKLQRPRPRICLYICISPDLLFLRLTVCDVVSERKHEPECRQRVLAESPAGAGFRGRLATDVSANKPPLRLWAEALVMACVSGCCLQSPAAPV